MNNLFSVAQQPWLFAVTAGLAIVMLAWGLIAGSNALFNPLRRRLASLRDGASPVVSTERQSAPGFLAMFEPRDEAKRRMLRYEMAQAGLHFAGAAGAVRFARIVMAFGTPALAQYLLTRYAPGVAPAFAFIAIALAAFAGWVLPQMIIEHRVGNRRAMLMEGFPDALDLLVACTEAGLSFNAALERVVEQMPASQPALAQELSQVNAEIRAGLDRSQALKNLADRTGLEEIRGLVSLITHSSRLGTGIAATLRIYAEEFRDRRMQKAEEVAAKVGTKLVFPLTVCLFPSFFVIAVGPAVVNVMNVLAAHPLT